MSEEQELLVKMMSREGYKQAAIDRLVALRSDGLTLRKGLQNIPGDIALRLGVCLAKLDAFDAAISMEIDRLRYEEH